MTLDEFIGKYTGKLIDYDGAYGGQCVDLYRQYVQEVLGFPQSPPVVGAADIWESFLVDKFERVLNTPEAVPSKGDIIIWNKNVGGGYGHVAIFVEGDVNTFRSFDQNWPTGSPPKIVDHKYTSVIGWLHPKEDSDALTECLKAHQSLMTQLEEKGKKLGSVEKKLAESLSTLEQTQKSEAEIDQTIKEICDGISLWQPPEEIANATPRNRGEWISLLKAKIGELTKQRNQYKVNYDNALDRTIEKATFKELLVEIIKRLKP